MCKEQEHRFRATVSYGSITREVVVYAAGAAAAYAKVDGYLHKDFMKMPVTMRPSCVTITIHHSTYGADASAIEHGAILSD